MSLKSINLDRANFVYNKIAQFKEDNSKKEIRDNFKSYAKNIPAYIKQNGLLATYAFVETKLNKDGDEAISYKAIYDMTMKWLCENNYRKNFNEKDNISSCLLKLSSDEYKSVEMEILNLFSWIRRFAEGELK